MDQVLPWAAGSQEKSRCQGQTQPPVLPKFTYKFNAVPITIPENCFVDIDKLILKFIWRSKRFRLTNTILKEKNKIGRLMLLNFKTYKATVIKVM